MSGTYTVFESLVHVGLVTVFWKLLPEFLLVLGRIAAAFLLNSSSENQNHVSHKPGE